MGESVSQSRCLSNRLNEQRVIINFVEITLRTRTHPGSAVNILIHSININRSEEGVLDVGQTPLCSPTRRRRSCWLLGGLYSGRPTTLAPLSSQQSDCPKWTSSQMPARTPGRVPELALFDAQMARVQEEIAHGV